VRRTVEEAVEAFIERPGLSDSYRRLLRGVLEPFAGQHGGRPVKRLRASDVDGYLRALEQRGAADSSLRTSASILRAFLRHAGASAEEVARVRRFRVKKRQRSYLREDEIPRFIQACKTPEERAVVLVLCSSGVRVSELIALRASDVDWKEGWLVVRKGKGGKYRKTRIGAKAREALHALHPKLAPSTMLFAFSAKHARQLVTRVAARVDLQDSHLRITPHALRRTFGITLLKRGVGIYTIKSYYGHSSVKQTEEYLGMSPEDFVPDHYGSRTKNLW